jgi:thioredoxin 1
MLKMAENNHDLEVTEEEFNEEINKPYKLVVADFFAEWCMPCLMLAPVIDELSEKFSDVKFMKVNVDDNENLAGKFDISSIPCIVLLKDGVEIDRIVGAQSSDAIEEKIKSYLG